MQALMHVAGYLLAVMSAAVIVVGIEALNGSETVARRRAVIEQRQRDY